MPNKKMKKNMMRLRSLRYRAHPHQYDKKVIERKRRLQKRIRHLKAVGSEAAA